MANGTCAYCGQVASLTREHIWPRCIIERVPTYVMRYSEKADKVFAADLVIKDVCSSCNNGGLSALDSYACTLYDKYFHNIVQSSDRVLFEYDHELLSRWLLKVSFNSARANSQDEFFHYPLRSFIMGYSPLPSFVSVMLDIVVPSVANGITIEPRMTRCGRALLGRMRHWICPRLVAINSFYFMILITGEKAVRVPTSELLEFRRLVRGRKLMPDGKLELQNHTSDFLQMVSHHFIHSKDNYAEFAASYKKSN